jgi:hypothetical protein
MHLRHALLHQVDDYYEKWLKTPEGSQLTKFVTNNLDAVDPEDLLYFDPQTTPHLNASELTGHARRKLEQLQVTSRVKVGTKKMRKWLLSFTLQAWWRDASKNPDDNAVYEVGGVDMEQLEAEGV